MPDVNTRHFGVVRCHEDAELFFPDGVPAFETAQRFVLIEQPATSPVVFLQSVESADLCFAALPILAVMPDYRLELSLEDLRLLELPETEQPRIGEQVACFAIISASENRQPSVNLLAPVVVNAQTRCAVQAIRSDSLYSHQHVLVARGVSCS